MSDLDHYITAMWAVTGEIRETGKYTPPEPTMNACRAAEAMTLILLMQENHRPRPDVALVEMQRRFVQDCMKLAAQSTTAEWVAHGGRP